jgi:hypothetical protein
MAKSKVEELKAEALTHQVSEVKDERIAKRETKEALAMPESLDWKKWSLPMTAAILTRIPMPGQDGDVFLTQAQATIWAIVSFEQGLSPFTGETWFNTKTHKVNLTLQGKLTRARQLGMNLGAPKFIRIPADEKEKLIAIKCVLPTSNGTVEYTATLSEWMMPSNPNWKNRSGHMLQVRSYEKAVSFAAGVGASEQPDDKDLGEKPEIPKIETTAAPITHPEVVEGELVEDNDGTKAEHYNLK